MKYSKENTVNITKEFLMCSLETAEFYAKSNSRCTKKVVGSYLMGIEAKEDGEEVLHDYLGYGGPSEGTHCKINEDGLCPRKYMNWAQDGCWSVHAEQRALIAAGFDLNPEYEWTMLVTHGPCDQCLKFMHHAGVSTVIYDVEYKTDYSKWEGKIKIISLADYIKGLEEK